MQGLHYLDLARTLSDERLSSIHIYRRQSVATEQNAIRHWLGGLLIRMGEALTPNTAELRPTVGTGPPWR